MRRFNQTVALIPAVTLLAASVFFTGCSDADMKSLDNKGEGALTLGVNLSAATKAAMTSDELIANSNVLIYKADFSGLVRKYVYSAAPEKIYLPVDSYRVDVVAGEAAKENPSLASWEQKSYAGSKEFAVVADQVTDVQVAANVSNAVTKISFDASVAENFAPGYTFTVGVEGVDAANLTYDASKSGSEGYFIIDGIDEPSLTWTFNGNLSKDGSAFTKTGTVPSVEKGKSYSINLKYTVKDGDVNFTLDVDYSTDIISDVVVFEPVSTGLSASSIYEIWAGHATVHADVDEGEFSDPSAIKFAYREQSGADWTTVDATRSSEGVYDAVLKGLKGSTAYEYKLVIGGKDQGESMTFTTEAAPNVPNASFEYVSKISGKDYYKWYDPNCAVEDCRTMFWGSGNGEGSEGVNGSANMGFVITLPDDTDFKDGERSVCAKTVNAVIKLAAGNIFTGQFAGLVGTKGGKVNFGRPWTSRPTAVRLWVKYTTGKIDAISGLPSGVTLTKNDYDRANVKVALGTWDYKTYGGTKDSPIQVNTTETSTFVDYKTDANTIANGELVLFGEGFQQINDGEKSKVTISEWRQITIPLEYRTETKYPTHIVIACASSMYGDYFTGSYSSMLWLDAVELLYE